MLSLTFRLPRTWRSKCNGNLAADAQRALFYLFAVFVPLAGLDLVVLFEFGLKFREEGVEFGVFEGKEDIVGLNSTAGSVRGMGMGTGRLASEGLRDTGGEMGKRIILNGWSRIHSETLAHLASKL